MNNKQDGMQQFDLHFEPEAKETFTNASPVDKDRSVQHNDDLLQELRTYQIELEMQNEELRSAYAALESSRDRYLQLYDFAPFGYLTLTEEGLIANANLTFATFLGVEREKLISHRFTDYVKSKDSNHWYHCLHATKQHREKQNCELTLLRTDGNSFQAYLECLYIEADDAPPVMHITLTDITKRKRAEEALQEIEIRHALALACADMGTWYWDIKSGRFDFSKRWAEIRGYRLEEIEPNISVWKNGIHPDNLPVVRAKLAEHLAGHTPFFQAEYRVPTKSGFWVWILDRGKVIDHDVEGNPLRMAGVEMDITGRKQAEESLRIAAAAFETQDGIIVTDAHKVILRANQAFSRITGYKPEESIGRTPSFLSSGLHDKNFYQTMWLSLQRNGYWHGEIWDKRKNGDIFPLWFTLTEVTDADGHITHYVGSFRDITIQKQAEKVLLDARVHLEKQVATTEAELEKGKTETAEINTALKVLLKHQETDKSDAQCSLLLELEGTVLPFLRKLKGVSAGRRQTTRLISILESNLQQLVQSYGRIDTLPAAYKQLTRIEMQVASLVRQGLSTKVIASTLNISPGTVSIHRKHIRKKLGLDGKASNLHSFLLSLTE